MAPEIRLIAEARGAKRIKPLEVSCYRIVGPWRIEEQSERIDRVPAGCALIRPLFIGICHADLRYISGSRPPEVLKERLPMAPFHEGVGVVVELGPDVKDFRVGQRVSIVPNLPCYVHDPWRYPSVEKACVTCRPGGAGENFCADARFLASNADGLARSAFVHPAAALLAVPDELPSLLAALAEPLSVAQAALEQAAPSASDNVAVLGAGVMGYLTALVASRLWAVGRERLLATDLFDDRLAQLADIAQALNVRDEGALKKFEGTFDVVFECAGGRAAETTIDQAIRLMKPGGRCVLVGVSEEPVPIRTRRMLDKGLMLRGTTRSAHRHFPSVLEKLAEPDFQPLARRVLHARVFDGNCVETILAAARTAANPESRGKVIMDWSRADEPFDKLKTPRNVEETR
jgi:ribitol-5-phosphate 2-dehydrogenase